MVISGRTSPLDLSENSTSFREPEDKIGSSSRNKPVLWSEDDLAPEAQVALQKLSHDDLDRHTARTMDMHSIDSVGTRFKVGFQP